MAKTWMPKNGAKDVKYSKAFDKAMRALSPKNVRRQRPFSR